MKISRVNESAFRDDPDQFHVLTYAEEGFSPLDLHARRFGIDRDNLKDFVKSANDLVACATLFPLAPISVVPRELVRDRRDANELAAHIVDFLRLNLDAIKSKRLVFDFRTPTVSVFALEALQLAILEQESGLEEILIVEM